MGQESVQLSLKVGEALGVSQWLEIDQTMIDSFGTASCDVEPLHTDPVWCSHNSPYGRPIAYGFQTISLLTALFHDVTNARFSGGEETQNFPLNYGFDRLRLISPVTVGSRIRGRFMLKDLKEKNPGELLLTVDVQVDIDGQDRPALIADWLLMWVTNEGSTSVTRAANG
ncbi:MAG: MaoC family dehydratase [Sphingomonadales bacterium]